ncbi:LOC34619382 [Symbiodinium pilosum]|uniref:LOC34619382 protein n=1 Tax=Symbiodinium pilosum TaxID=2952 RepID=A0A812IRW0_SYMPI|nr:LOC34619382 [Symbiodinium pilosum]
MSEGDLVNDLKSGTDMIRYEIVQASLNQETSNYRAHVNQDHLSRGDVRASVNRMQVKAVFR